MSALFWCSTVGLLAGGAGLLWRVRRRLELEAEADRAFWSRYREPVRR